MKVVPFIHQDQDDLLANTYLLVDEANDCVVIDPSALNHEIENYVNKHCLTMKGILLTHGHFDHIKGVNVLAEKFNVPIFVGFYDFDKLSDPETNCSYYFNLKVTVDYPVSSVSESEKISLLKEDIVVLETPYHTSGSISYFLKESKIVFTGDALFKGCIGRSDLPTGDSRLIDRTLRKLLSLDKEIKVYPGHGPFTSIQEERIVNKFVK